MQNKFFKVFKAGKYPQGEITADDVAELAATYSPDFHEAPLTVLHDEKSPAYAVVDQVKADNGILYASFKDMLDEAYDVNKKYRKPSIEIANYDDKKYLRAIALTNFPQVKGMDKIQFSENSNLFFSEDLTLTLSKGEKMFPENVIKLAEAVGVNISDYQVEGDLIARATEIVGGLNLELAASRDKINSLNISLAAFVDAGVTIEKYTEMKEQIGNLNKLQIENLISNALKEKNILPASTESLRKLAETNFEEAKKFVDCLPAKSAANLRMKPNNEASITYEEVLNNPELSKNFNEEELNNLKKQSKIF